MWNPYEVIAHQQAMNSETWTTLLRHGVTEATELRLEFTYDAPDAHAAEILVSFLRQETDYDVKSEGDVVNGTTQRTTISPEILDEWVSWMVAAGHEYGYCKFDGWRTMLPAK